MHQVLPSALVAPYKGLEDRVDLDATDNTRRLQKVCEGGIVGGVLVERLLEQDGTGDKLPSLGARNSGCGSRGCCVTVLTAH